MISTFSEAFTRAVEPHAAWCVDQLETFNGFLPEGSWSADLEQRVFQQGGREMRVSLLGTYDEDASSWLWGWANPGFQDRPIVAATAALREFGQAHGVREFADELVDVSAFENPRMAAETLAYGAMGVLRSAGYIGVQAGPTTRAYLVPDDPQVPWAVPDGVTLPRILMTGVGVLGGASARAVVTGYFDHHKLPRQQSPDAVSAQLPDGSTATVSFDGLGRIAEVSVTVAARP